MKVILRAKRLRSGRKSTSWLGTQTNYQKQKLILISAKPEQIWKNKDQNWSRPQNDALVPFSLHSCFCVPIHKSGAFAVRIGNEMKWNGTKINERLTKITRQWTEFNHKFNLY